MSEEAVSSSTLYELAQTIIGREDYTTAIALRKLARAGYTSLEQVDAAPDWVLFATPGIGIHRLTAARRLVRPGWRPPRRRVIKDAERFLSTARFALRLWSIEDLEAVVQDPESLPTEVGPVEKRIALKQFAKASRKARRHCTDRELVETLRQLMPGRDRHVPADLDAHQVLSPQPAPPAESHPQPRTATPPDTPPEPDATDPQGSHYAFGPEERRQIVEHYRTARRCGEVENKEAWAYNNYNISRKTLWRYEQEFPARPNRRLVPAQSSVDMGAYKDDRPTETFPLHNAKARLDRR